MALGPHEGGEGALRALNRNVERVFNPEPNRASEARARGRNIDAVCKTLATAGVTFLSENDDGVRVRGKAKGRRATNQ